MKMNFKATHVSLTPDLEKYLSKRMAGLEKFMPKGSDSANAQVELSRTTTHHKSGPIFRAEIRIHTHGKTYFASAEREDIFAAIDALREEIMRELGSSKQKRMSLLRRGSRQIKNIIRGINPWGDKKKLAEERLAEKYEGDL